MDIKAAILRGADAIDARDRFDPEKRKGYMNASEAMSCIRKQWYAKNDAPLDEPESWGYARRGSHGEKYIVECLRMANVPMLFTGDEQVRIVDEERGISCTPDGLAMLDTEEGWLACEFKTLDPRTNVSNLPRTNHVTQLQIGMELFNENLDDFPEMQGKGVVSGMLVYMDASNYDTIHQFPVRRSTKILDKLQGRASRLLRAKDASRLPREGKEQGGRECKTMCKFNKVCGIDMASTSTGQGRLGAGDFSTNVSAYLSAKDAEAQAKARKDTAGEQLKALLQREGVAVVEVDGHTVSLSQRAGSVAYAKVVKEHLPDVDLEAYRGNPSEVLTVK